MGWVRIRSLRDPSFWVPFAAAFLLVALLGVCLHFGAATYLRHLRELATTDPQAASAAAVRALRGLGWFLTSFVLLIAALLARSCQLGLQQGRIPPLGWWSLGAYRVATGATAVWLGRAGFALAIFMGLLGIATGLLFEHLIDTLLAVQLAS